MKTLMLSIIPNSSKTEERETLENGIQKIAVKASPEKGKANKELIRFFKKEKNITISIISGKTSRIKLIKIHDGTS